jgi:hypothetical protein
MVDDDPHRARANGVDLLRRAAELEVVHGRGGLLAGEALLVLGTPPVVMTPPVVVRPSSALAASVSLPSVSIPSVSLPAAARRTLPVTGGDVLILVLVALGAIAAGGGMTVIGRRRFTRA